MRRSNVSQTAVVIWTCIVAASLMATRVLAIDITTPGQSVPPGEVGIVQNDIVCAPPSSFGVGNGGTFDLNGHVLDGCGIVASGSPPEVQRIAVRGPGEIRNSGIYVGGAALRVNDVEIHDAPLDGIFGSDGSSVRASGVTVTGSGRFGIIATTVRAKNVTSTGNGVSQLGNGIVGWGGVVGRNLTVTGNQGEGVYSAAGRTSLRDSEVTGNAYSGVIGFRVSLVRSTVTGNNTGAHPSTYDLVSSYPPRVADTTCGTSRNSNDVSSWGVCSGD